MTDILLIFKWDNKLSEMLLYVFKLTKSRFLTLSTKKGKTQAEMLNELAYPHAIVQKHGH